MDSISAISIRATESQLAAISQLSAADRKVRAHEQAHLAAAGPYAIGGPSYSYQLGPDGKLYAVGGEVSIDVSPDSSDPRRTIEKARTIEAAADAPADPSPQDHQVAAAAAQMAAQAEMELLAKEMQTAPPSGSAAAYGRQDPPDTGQNVDVTG